MERSKWPRRSTLSVCSNNLSSYSRPSSAVPRVALLSFHTPSVPIRVFSVQDCTARTLPAPAPAFHSLYREQEWRKRALGWRRTHKDPFEGEWEQIISWLVANPERSSGDIFQELQRRSPGRYQPSQIRTLQRGMRKIRAHLLEAFEEQWRAEVIRGPSPPPVSIAARPTRIS
jgi:hypothetical protein